MSLISNNLLKSSDKIMVFIFGSKDAVINVVFELVLEIDLVTLKVSQTAVGGSEEGGSGAQVPFPVCTFVLQNFESCYVGNYICPSVLL